MKKIILLVVSVVAIISVIVIAQSLRHINKRLGVFEERMETVLNVLSRIDDENKKKHDVVSDVKTSLPDQISLKDIQIIIRKDREVLYEKLAILTRNFMYEMKNNGNASDAKYIGVHVGMYADGVLEVKESKAYDYMKERKYFAAYALFDDVVKEDSSRYMSRYYRAYCLFYSNPMDRKNYAYILSELEALNKIGLHSEGIDTIKKAILAEQEGERGRP